MSDAGSDTQTPPLTKLLIDLGPLAVFFIANAVSGIYAATGAFMVATVAALIASRLAFGTISMMPLVSAALVLVFGGLTLYLHNETFIKMKPTVIYLLFAVVLMAGLALGRPFLKLLLGEVFELREEGWNKLTVRWCAFFVGLAVLNEIVWRNVSTDMWVNFKVFALVPLTFLFAALQVGLMQKYAKSGK